MADRAVSLRRLIVRLQQGAQLRRAGGAFLLSGRRGPKTCVASGIVDALIAEGLVHETADGVGLTSRGERWLQGASDLELEARLVTGSDGCEQYAVVNVAESPLSLLAHRGLISVTAFEAGDTLRRDYTIGQISPRMGVDYSAPVGSHAFRPDLTVTVVAARQRFNLAMRAAGPGLADVLFDVCCYLVNLEDCEKTRGWPRGAAKVVLVLALDRLAAHYGMTAASRARPHTWSNMDGAE